MKRLLPVLLLAVPLALLGQSSKVPSSLSFQGRVVDAAGKPLGIATDGLTASPVNRKVTFRIYSHAINNYAASGLWSEEQNVTISAGDFNVLLGAGTAVSGEARTDNFGDVFLSGALGSSPPVPNDHFIPVERYLGITVDDGNSSTNDPEISPRQQMVTGAFAFRARVAEKVDGLAITTGMLANNAVTAEKFSSALPLGFSGSNLGIGNAAPLSLLTVGNGLQDQAGSKSTLTFSGASAAPEIKTRPGLYHRSAVGLGFFSDSAMSFEVGGGAGPLVEAMRITSGGNVGIGTTTPAAHLDVFGNTDQAMQAILARGLDGKFQLVAQNRSSSNADGAEVARFGVNYEGSGWTSGLIFYRGGTDTGSLGFMTGNQGSRVERMRISEGGNVGIGNSAPLTTLTIGNAVQDQGTASKATLTLSGASAAPESSSKPGLYHRSGVGLGVFSDTAISFQVAGSTSLVDAMRIGATGNIALGANGFAKNANARGELILDNSSGDTPGIHFYDNNSSNWGIDSFAGSLRFVKNLDEATALQAVTITNTGRVGIGTAAPRFPLDVTGFVNASINLLAYLDAAGAFDRPDNEFYNLDTTIAAEKRIRSAGFDVTSDARIKKNLAEVGTAAALDAVRRLRITDYRYVDAIAQGRKVQRGLIAQEVEKIMPDAIRRSTDFVPDIFARALTAKFDPAARLLRVALSEPHRLQPNDVVRLLTDRGPVDVAVREVLSPLEFLVPTDAAPGNVFVYGRQVDDFRTVDYDRVFSTGIAAIQEVAKQVDALKASEARNAALEQRVRELEAKVAGHDEWKAAFEKRFASLAAATKAAATTGNSQ